MEMEVPDTTSLSEEGLVVERETHGSEKDEGSTCGVVDGENEASGDESLGDRSEEHSTVTIENKNANESNVASSSMTSFSSLERSDSKNIEELSDENAESSKVQTLVFAPSWTESLKSPTHLLGFSPSETGSYHGLGLQAAVERNVATALFLGNVSLFLSSTATLYDQLGVNLVKISKVVHPQELPRETSITDDFQALHEDILSLGSGFRSLAKWYRTSLTAPLKKFLSTNVIERDAAIKQYKELRQASVQARKSALANYSKLTNATKTAEDEIQIWLSKLQRKKIEEIDRECEDIEGTTDAMEKDLPWEKSLKRIGKEKNEGNATFRLVQKLKLVQSCRIQYSKSVEKENNCVMLSEESESLALSKAQKEEEDQMNFFVKDILSQVFPNDNTGVDLPVARASIAMNNTDSSFTEGIEKKGIELLSNLNLFKQQNIPYEEGMGVMDAETLGLPESLGIQRDNIKASFSARENRIEVTEIIIKLFEEIAGVTSKSSFRMLSQITNQRRKDASEGPTSESFYNSTVGSIWRKTLSVFEDEAKLISDMGFKIVKLEKWLTMSKRSFENEIELDDAAWRRVCDAARVETKLELRYKQTRQHVEKVRQRASSKELSLSQRGSRDSSDDAIQSQRKRNDSSGSIGKSFRPSSGTQSTPNRVGRAFFKGGEAMKKLTSMVQIAQISMNEVDQKEAKDQLAFEEASTEKKSAVLAYASCTKERIEKIDFEDNSGWVEMKGIILKLAESTRALKNVRFSVFQNRISREIESSFQTIITDMEEWSVNVQEKIHQSEGASSSKSCPEYALSIQQIKSDTIDPLLGMTEKDLTVPKLEFNNESTNERSEDQPTESREVTPPSGKDVHSDDGADDEVGKLQKLTVAKLGSKINVSESGNEKRPVPACSDDITETEKETSLAVKAFIKQFWSKKPKDQKVPTILDTYACAYRPKEKITFLNPTLQGKLFTTKEAIYFLAADKNFTLRWETIKSVEKEKGFMGSNNENGLVVSYRSEDTISSFLLCRLKDRDNVVANLQRLKAENQKSEDSQVSESKNDTGARLPPVPPDTLLQNMEIVVAKTIKNVSIKSIFENVWADRTESQSFYGSWLKEEECFDIRMGEWEIAEPGDKFRNEWCDEKYDCQRLVTFKFNRTTHLYIGPPVAIVKQRHFLRVEDNDKCVLAISAEFDGIPYADTFAVEMRWVATRTERNNVRVEVGLFVNFKKNTMLKSQIKSGTITETKNVHLRLFEAVKKACTDPKDGVSHTDNDQDEEVEEEIERNMAELNIFSRLGQFSGSLDGSKIVSFVGVVALLFAGRYLTLAILGNSGQSDIQRLENHLQELRNEVRALHKSIDLVALLLKDSQSNNNNTK